MAEAALLDEGILQKYTKTVTLRDGRTLHVRPIMPSDEDKLIAMFIRLNWHTIYLRFHHVMTHMSKEQARALCTVDYDDSFALVGIIGEEPDERMIAVARYLRLPSRDSAEVAFLVDDPYQGQGVGTQLLEELAEIARSKGITHMEAEVLAENSNMMVVFQDSGFKVADEIEHGVYSVVLDIAPTETFIEKSAERDKISAIASIKAFLEPKSIAVIGASNRQGTIGNAIFGNILQNRFSGVVYPVNPKANVVMSVLAYETVLDIPGEVDMAVIIVPSKAVLEAVQQCGRKGVKGLVIISSGFGEIGPEGKVLQKHVVDTAARYGMRIIGPNCFGLINTDPKISMNATFARTPAIQGDIAFGTQSGGLGLAILEYCSRLNIGLSTFASIGNRADIDTTDLLQYWEQDPNTKLNLLYMESFGSPRKFTRTARRISRHKPIIVVKSGRTSAGARAAASHTGAMASVDAASDALFKQAGIIRVDTLEELFGVATLVANQPLPKSNRIAIVTNGGGPGIMTADAAAAAGLEIPDLSEKTKAALKACLPPEASILNPIDMTGGGGAIGYLKTMEILADEENVDTVVVIFVPPFLTEAAEVAEAIRSVMPAYKRNGKTLISSFIGKDGNSLDLGSPELGYVPSYTFPETIAMALRKVCQYRDWLDKPEGIIPDLPGINRDKAQQIIHNALKQNSDSSLWLTPQEIEDLLAAYGIQGIPTRKAKTAEETGLAAKELGFPVVIKLLSDTITHKSDVGGVILDIRNQQDAEAAFNNIKARLTALGKESEMDGVVIQKMISGGVETIVGVSQDPSFGPLILFGMGGTTAELFKDVTLRIHPLTDVDAKEMIQSVKAHKLLAGWRGSKPADIPALEDVLLRISAMVEDIPQISEMDLNPVKVLDEGQGYAVVDARILIKENEA